MKRKFQKGDENWMAFVDLYQFVQDFWEPETNDDYWVDLITGASSLANKYNGNEFIKQMLMAYMDSREKEYKKGHS